VSIQSDLHRRPSWRNCFILAVIVLVFTPAAYAQKAAVSGVAPATPAPTTNAAPAPDDQAPLIKLGVGDTVTVQVYGKPELSTTTYLADDGTILVPLVGAVQIAGLSPAQASTKIADALRTGEFLVNPQVSITLVQSRSQQVSVLGEVGKPGRYAVESTTTVFDLLALAGGRSVEGATIIYLLRTDSEGNTNRTPINLGGLTSGVTDMPAVKLQGGDTLFVPRADQFFVYGEVTTPNQYRLEVGMTLEQALARAGGITRRGSSSRIEIKRRKPDGSFVVIHPKLNDPVQANDVIRVKESIF